jgi:hypothetical protein
MNLLTAMAVTTTIGLAALLPTAPTASASASAKTRDCRDVSVTVAKGKRAAHGIRATGLGCAKARTTVRACLRDSLRGWRVSHSPSLDDTNPKGLVGLDRRSSHISFTVRGRGACG